MDSATLQRGSRSVTKPAAIRHLGMRDSAPHGASVVMFVMNPVTRDRRVLKEAGSLSKAGYWVTIIGINLDKAPRPAREDLPGGVTIVRVPLSMSPERWRPSPRYFVRMGDLARRQRKLARQRFRRAVGNVRLGSQRRSHRAGRRVDSILRTRRHRLERWLDRWSREPSSAWRHDVVATGRQLRRGGHRLGVRIARMRRLTAAFSRRQAERIHRLATDTMARRWAVHRAERRVRGGFKDARPPVERFGRGVVRGMGVVLHLPVQAAFTVWAAAYLAINRLTGGELDWALNTRQRWSSYAHSAAMVAPLAAVYHAHDLSALAAGVKARDIHGGRLIYDSHELYVESGSIGMRSRLLKGLLRHFERRWFQEADHVVSVNRLVADELHRQYGPKPTTLVHNCPPRWAPPTSRPDLIREATGIPHGAPIALYQGAFSAVRGLRQISEALLMPGMEAVHVVYMGFGPMEAELRALARDPQFGGRLWVLPPVDPDALDPWVASADVSLMPNQPATLNEIISTPNKLFESIAAGVPVVTSDFPERRRIVLEDPLGALGAVCNPSVPASIAAAILDVIGKGPEHTEALRSRCLAAAHRTWNWETEEARLVELYSGLIPTGYQGGEVRAVG